MGTFTNIFSRASKPIKSKAEAFDVNQILKDPGAVLYGSRALGVNHQKSDYDIALSYESHKYIYSWLLSANILASSNIDYFTSVPEAGYHTFFQHHASDFKVDIIFVHNDEDLDVIRSSVRDLQSIPAYMLTNKPFRIEAYNRALQHRGWKPAPHVRDLFRNNEGRRDDFLQQIPPDILRQHNEFERRIFPRRDSDVVAPTLNIPRSLLWQ